MSRLEKEFRGAEHKSILVLPPIFFLLFPDI